MLKSEYDCVVIGKNYLSFILSLFFLKSKRSVLIIDDERVKYGENWHKNIGEIERNFLQLLGLEYEIDALKEIQSVLTPSPYYVYLNNRMILLGQSAFQNIKELMRKIPECFSSKCHDLFQSQNEKEFNRAAEIFFYNISENSFRLKRTQNFDESVIDRSMDNLLRTIFNDFLLNYYSQNQESKLLARQLLFALQGKFQSLFSDSYSKTEIKYLLTQALSPRYILDENVLNQKMQDAFTEKNGVIKNTTIQYWQFYQKKLTSILLSSYEGVIHPNQTYFVGNFHSGLPFSLEKKYRVFTDLILQVRYPEDIFQNFESLKILYNPSERLGSDYPMWESEFVSPRKANVRYLYPLQPGTKPEFFTAQARKDVFQSLEKTFAAFSSHKAQDLISVKPGYDLWSEAFSFTGGKTNKAAFAELFHDKGLKILNAEDKQEVKSFQYWGPMQMHPLGLFSFLLDIKNNYLQ